MAPIDRKINAAIVDLFYQHSWLRKELGADRTDLVLLVCSKIHEEICRTSTFKTINPQGYEEYMMMRLEVASNLREGFKLLVDADKIGG